MADENIKSAPQTPPEGLFRKVDREQGYRKAAEFLLLLEKSRAARVLSLLSEEEVEGIIKEIAGLQNVSPAEAKKIAAEFGLPEAGRQAAGAVPAPGGLDAARDMLQAAFGEERMREIIDKIKRQLEPGHFSFLKGLNRDQLVLLFQDESPQVVALVLAQLEPEAASAVIESLSSEKQKDVAKRIAQMDKVLPEVIRRTADTLKKKLFQQSAFSTLYIDGKSALRDIMKHMDFGRERALLDTLSEEKPELAEQLEKELFTMEIFKKLRAKDLQLFLRDVTDRDIAVSLKGEEDDLQGLFFNAVSARRKTFILEESKLIGEVPRKEADKVRRVLLDALKTKIGTGEIVLLEENDSFIL
jgi:flagellar motor switch protein FliG